MMILDFFKKDNIGEPPWDYDFLYNLPENEYPKYLKKIYKYRTGKALNLKNPKTFSEKLQWIKLYGVTPLMRDCTDKIKVREYVKEKIGEKYLKPVLQIIPNETSVIASRNGILDGEAIRPIEKNIQSRLYCHGTQNVVVPRNDGKLEDVSTYFDRINWDKLTNAFVIKCNHGSKWQYIIKDKNLFLQNKRLINIVKKNITGWLEQDYSFWCGFEMQYKNIEPKIFIEPLLRENLNIPGKELQIYCFNGNVEFAIVIINENLITAYDKNCNILNDFLIGITPKRNIPADNNLKKAYELSSIISRNFNFVRVDWMIYNDKNLSTSLYFEELTFTPYSGFKDFGKNQERMLGDLLSIK